MSWRAWADAAFCLGTAETTDAQASAPSTLWLSTLHVQCFLACTCYKGYSTVTSFTLDHAVCSWSSAEILQYSKISEMSADLAVCSGSIPVLCVLWFHKIDDHAVCSWSISPVLIVLWLYPMPCCVYLAVQQYIKKSNEWNMKPFNELLKVTIEFTSSMCVTPTIK